MSADEDGVESSSPSSSTGNPIIALLIGVVGLAMTVWLFTLTRPYADGVTVEGRVVTSEQVGERRLVFHQSDVEFVDEQSGVTYVVTSEVGSFFAPDPGDTRRVSYRPGAPSDGRVLEGGIFVWLFGFMSLLFLAPSIHVLTRQPRSAAIA